MASLPGCTTRDRRVLALRGQKIHGRSHERRRARATGCDQEGWLCRTLAEELERWSIGPKGLAWSMAAAGQAGPSHWRHLLPVTECVCWFIGGVQNQGGHSRD